MPINIDPKDVSDEAYRELCVAIDASIRRLKKDPLYIEGFEKWKAERAAEGDHSKDEK